MSLLKERVLNNSYKAYIKNLVGSKKEIIINDNNTIEDLKIIVIKKLYNTNVKKLLENFPYYIVYKGCRINKEYDLNTTMKELDVKDETVFYVIDDMDCKKLIEKASSMVLTPPISLASSNISKKNINKEKEKEKNKNKNKNKNKQVRSYSDGCFKSLENPNLSPSQLSLETDKKPSNTEKTTRNRYNSISAIENDDSSTYSSQELNSSNDIIGLSQLSLLNSNSISSVNTSYSDNSNTECNNNENKYRKRNNSRSKRERVLSKFHPPQLNKELENNELLDDDIFDINNNEINNNQKNNEKKIELDKSQELILEALKNMPNSSILLSSSQLPSPPPPSPPPLTKEMSEQLQKTINTSLDEIKNIKLSQSKITEKFEKTQEYMLEIKKELENNNKNNGEKKTQIDSDISTIKDNFTSLNNSNVLALNNNIEVNNTILSYLKKINTENSNIEEIKNEYSKQIIEQINNKFTEKILKSYKNIIKDKEEQIQNQQQELYITKGISVFSTGLLIVLLFFQIISSAYK